MNALPYGKLYYGSFFTVGLRGCSEGAQALWMHMLCLMGQSEEFGTLVKDGAPMTMNCLARQSGFLIRRVPKLVAELEKARMFVRNAAGAITDLGMVKNLQTYNEKAAAGASGGRRTQAEIRVSTQFGRQIVNNGATEMQPSGYGDAMVRQSFTTMEANGSLSNISQFPVSDRIQPDGNRTPQTPDVSKMCLSTHSSFRVLDKKESSKQPRERAAPAAEDQSEGKASEASQPPASPEPIVEATDWGPDRGPSRGPARWQPPKTARATIVTTVEHTWEHPAPDGTYLDSEGTICCGDDMVGAVFDLALDTAGMNPATSDATWRTVIGWLREGSKGADIKAAIARAAIRENYLPPRTLAYFSNAVRENRARLSA